MCPVGANLGSDFQSWWALSPVLEAPHTCRARSLMYGACTVCHCLVAGRGGSYSFSFWTSQEIQSVVRWWGHDSAQRMISRELERMHAHTIHVSCSRARGPHPRVYTVVINSFVHALPRRTLRYHVWLGVQPRTSCLHASCFWL